MQAIFYACPHDPYCQQVQNYYDNSAHRLGANTAHRYMPHVTLTGFFTVAADMLAAITQATADAVAADPTPSAQRTVELGMPRFSPQAHYVPVHSHWWQSVTASMSQYCQQALPPLAIRRKHDLHLSLSYDFLPADHEALQQQAIVDGLAKPPTAVDWQWRLYTRTISDDDQWHWQLLWSEDINLPE